MPFWIAHVVSDDVIEASLGKTVVNLFMMVRYRKLFSLIGSPLNRGQFHPIVRLTLKVMFHCYLLK